MSNIPIYFCDCRHFRGDVPCRPHKMHGNMCGECIDYAPTDGNILIVKLGAIGDVIRTTPLVERLRKEYPRHLLWWITQSPEILPSGLDYPLLYSFESVQVVQNTKFDLVINLDKAIEACALASAVESDDKRGFILKNGRPFPADSRAEHKFITGLFDNASQENVKSYLEEIFEICGWTFNGEEYNIEVPDNSAQRSSTQVVVGLNTGCGDRWTSRLWSDNKWAELTTALLQKGYRVVLLGGKQEHDKNKTLSIRTGAEYKGHVPLKDFIGVIDSCDVIVTGITMALHLAIAVKKEVVAINNIFNPHEFELYGRGEIIQPQRDCQCYYSPACNNREYNCMDHLSVAQVLEAVLRRVAMLETMTMK